VSNFHWLWRYSCLNVTHKKPYKRYVGKTKDLLIVFIDYVNELNKLKQFKVSVQKSHRRLQCTFDVLTSIVSFYTGPQSRGGVAYGVTSLQANRNTVTKASRRGVATSTTIWRHIMDTTTALLHKQQDGGTSWISQRQFERTY
jgi:hypothetical protein